MKKLKLIIAIALAFCIFLYALAFVLSNHAQVDVDLLFVQLTQWPVEAVVLASFFLGAAMGLGSAAVLLWLSRRKNQQLLKRYTQHIG